MTVSTLRPNATTSNNGALTGGATAHAVLSDNSDASYITLIYQASPADLDSVYVGFDDLTLPAGAVIKSVAMRARVAKVSGAGGFTLWDAPDPDIGLAAQTSIPWSIPTTVTLQTLTVAGIADADVDGVRLQALPYRDSAPSDGTLRLYELCLDVTYVVLPVVSVDAPAGTLSSNVPTVEWSNTLDAAGGAQTRYEVKVYTDAQYGAGGFDPVTSTPTTETGITTGAALEWLVDQALPDDTYRAYVRVAQTVSGELHWSDWDFSEFTVDVALPAAPTFTATEDDANARITLEVEENTGDATTDAFELQRSLDAGATWEPVRQLAAGPITPDAGQATVYDYEAPNGLEAHYRARALHDYSGVWAVSDWATDEATWADNQFWLKHPHRPDLNLVVDVRAYDAAHRRQARAGVFQALGRIDPIVVQDKPGPKESEITLAIHTAQDRDAIEGLYEMAAALLIQAPPQFRPPRYVRLMNHEPDRLFDTFTYVVVNSPPGDVVAWP